ncbi:acetolactate synthase small subunit [Zobellia sp. B3R18]|uniref:acetolactate synthase small subunit n=1 Tax=Zobellia sp. B3R18 TaxID=2841568 RepID=UPI001C072A19|nr:acetolactate synthase small subunit [Zobellia sp. B3R18]MBU2975089.1 hypothetical protein [Zobellia sp. B3R18]
MNIDSYLTINDSTENILIVYVKNDFGVLENILKTFSEKFIHIESVNSITIEKQKALKIVLIVKSKNSQLASVIELIRNKEYTIEVENYIDSEVIYNELAYYKISYDYFLNNPITSLIINQHRVEIVEINREFIFLEQKGSRKEIINFLKEIKSHGLVKFNSSGKIIINKY